MAELLLYIGCGLSAGVLGGYLGLGGGIIMVPYLTLLGRQSISAAVPVSLAAIAISSLSASTEYLKKGMVDLKLVVLLVLFMAAGNIAGSFLNGIIPADTVRIMFTIILLYAAIAFVGGFGAASTHDIRVPRGRQLVFVVLSALIAGLVSGLLGVGGGVVLIPALVLTTGLPLTIARGTNSFVIGFSAAASTVVFLMQDRINLMVVGPVILGIVLGGKLGGWLGALAKPVAVRIIFFVVLIYMALRLGFEPILELWR